MSRLKSQPKSDDSPAMQLLSLAWKEDGKAFGSHSWSRLNSTMQTALGLAIGHGFAFDIGDFAQLGERFNFGYWGGVDNGGFAERYYSLACSATGRGFGVNLSACRSFEAWKKRPAYILKDRDSPSGRRLACESRFVWSGEEVFVTSFADDGLSLTACSYKPDPKGGYGRKVLHRHRITAEEVKAASAAFTKARKAEKPEPSAV